MAVTEVADLNPHWLLNIEYYKPLGGPEDTRSLTLAIGERVEGGPLGSVTLHDAAISALNSYPPQVDEAYGNVSLVPGNLLSVTTDS